MNFDINIVAGLAAGVAAMVPGAIIYTPGVLGNRWMKEIGTTKEEIDAAGGGGSAVAMMLVTSLVNGLVASVVASLAGADSVKDGLIIGMILAWFMVSANLMLVFFERRSWAWLWITSLSHVLTFAVIGLVIGLFL